MVSWTTTLPNINHVTRLEANKRLTLFMIDE